MSPAKVAGLTVLAISAFAANSILCRVALADQTIDPASFTAVRLISGALVLAAMVYGSKDQPQRHGSWFSGAMLFAYAIFFSFAYVGLTAGTGALLLFGSVQATMLGVSIFTGHKPSAQQWAGLALALAGLVYLVAPGLSAPPTDRALMMILAGVAWGVYSLKGKGVSNPVGATAGNFLRASLMGFGPLVLFLGQLHLTPAGLFWAIASGAITSGLGYVVWYAALPHLGAIRAAIVQLTVPVLAAVAGILLLGEELTARLVVAGVVTLGGVALAVVKRQARTSQA